MAGLVFESGNNNGSDDDYWFYHKGTIEDDEEERLHPAEKAWQVVKYANPDTLKGSRLRIGDTVKFGRVRFKIIMMHSESEGE